MNFSSFFFERKNIFTSFCALLCWWRWWKVTSSPLEFFKFFFRLCAFSFFFSSGINLLIGNKKGIYFQNITVLLMKRSTLMCVSLLLFMYVTVVCCIRCWKINKNKYCMPWNGIKGIHIQYMPFEITKRCLNNFLVIIII